MNARLVGAGAALAALALFNSGLAACPGGAGKPSGGRPPQSAQLGPQSRPSGVRMSNPQMSLAIMQRAANRPMPEAAPAIPPTVEQLVEQALAADRNGDGKLSLREVPESLKLALKKFDANGDKCLDALELTAAATQFLAGNKIASK